MMNCSCRFLAVLCVFACYARRPSKGVELESVDDSSTYWLGSAEVAVKDIGEALNGAAADVAYLDDDDKQSAVAVNGETDQVGLWLKQQ